MNKERLNRFLDSHLYVYKPGYCFPYLLNKRIKKGMKEVGFDNSLINKDS